MYTDYNACMMYPWKIQHFDGLVQNCSSSSVLAMELWVPVLLGHLLVPYHLEIKRLA